MSFRRARLPTGPTHILGGILDVVIVSSDLPQLPRWHTYAPNQYSDHSLLEIHLPLHKPTPVLEVFQCRPWNRFDKNMFLKSLEQSILCDNNFISSSVSID